MAGLTVGVTRVLHFARPESMLSLPGSQHTGGRKESFREGILPRFTLTSYDSLAVRMLTAVAEVVRSGRADDQRRE